MFHRDGTFREVPVMVGKYGGDGTVGGPVKLPGATGGR